MNEPALRPISTIVREAEAHDHEAVAEIEAAQQPQSDGGELITPREATRIRMHVLKSALLDNEAATLVNAERTGGST